jgi:hypothetical protein
MSPTSVDACDAARQDSAAQDLDPPKWDWLGDGGESAPKFFR